jgi:L-2-hydroxyglutarate oxidase LhgO
VADAAVTVIGGGVIGLAVAAELSKTHSPLFVLERRENYGQETSSRNSEVIHAGIYYTPNSLKARLCVEGKHLLYDLCAHHDIPHRRITKIITAAAPEERSDLDRILKLGNQNGASLSMLTAAQVRSLEPHVVTFGGILSPTTGIISAHGLMDFFAHTAVANGAVVQTRCTVTGLERHAHDYLISIDEGGNRSAFSSEIVVNAAGLEADTIASMAGIDIDTAGYRLHYCKGCYFSLPSSYRSVVTRLVYPVPGRDSLGVHVVLDLGGRVKFGPDVEYLPGRSLEYGVPESKRTAFAASVRHILPMIRDEELTPDMSGIRPKLQTPGGPARDFIIREESDRGLTGLIDLIGIDSPGLTASPAIARYVRSLL